MDKALQDKAWDSLPAEFRKEVREIYHHAKGHVIGGDYENGMLDVLVGTFGSHNLTSKEEPEKEYVNLSKSSSNYDKQFDNILRMNTEAERRQIAAMIMQGILANADEVHRAGLCSTSQEMPIAIAEYAVACADALIAELNKRKEEK